MKEFRYDVLSQMIDRELMNYVNRILHDHYYIQRGCRASYHEWTHICSVIFFAVIVYSDIMDKQNKIPTIRNVNILILAGLFHDIGRKDDNFYCIDGPDNYERNSVRIAYDMLIRSRYHDLADDVAMVMDFNIGRELTRTIGPKVRVRNMRKTLVAANRNRVRAKLILNKKKHEELKRLHIVLKTADSMDILRVVGRFNRDLCPIYRSGIPHTADLYLEENLRTFNNIRNLLRKPRYIPKNNVVIVNVNANNIITLTTNNLIWTGPYTMLNAADAADGDDAVQLAPQQQEQQDEEDDGRIYEDIGMGQRQGIQVTSLSAHDDLLPLTRAQLARLPQDIKRKIVRATEKLNTNDDELREYTHNIRNILGVQENYRFLFDIFLLGILPLIPSIPLYNRLSSYIHYPYYTPSTINGEGRIVPI